MYKMKCRHIALLISLLMVWSACTPPDSGPLTPSQIKKAEAFALSRLKQTLNEIPAGQYPIRTQGLGPWELTTPDVWTSGFFPGCLWLAYELTEDTTWIRPAERFTEGLADQQYNTSHHDIGFMILNSFGHQYAYLQDEQSKQIILQSARSLATRYNEQVGCTQSWDGAYQVIIDNMMNLEILFWAAKYGGDPGLAEIAIRHANKTIENHLREDGSAFHVVVYDTSTGDVLEKRTAQGYAAESAWARGQAWGIYGFTMCFRETGDSTYLNTAEKMADYWIRHLPSDGIPYWDFKLPKDDPRQFRDASAAAIACSGMLELRNYVRDPENYDRTVNRMLGALIRNYLSDGTESSGILLHCAYNANHDNPYDRDASTIWGDYYFLETLKRYIKTFDIE